ncbi:MAG: zf-TFIIB domain-containing protein [Dehalococcoidales bacterium]|nr:zf-TFIIB domain-containing protein [Dehalococcoidales bacterium]
MLCPVCKTDMIDLEHDKIELDYCVRCKGVWFDSNELELLFEKMNLKNCSLSIPGLIDNIDEKIPENKHKCPICKKTMGKIKIGDSSQTVIDICINGDGLWFDGGEVIQLIKHTSHNIRQDTCAEQQVINFLGEVFHI